MAEKLHPRLVARAGLAVLVEAELAGDHAAHLAALAEDQRARRHAGEDLDAQRLGLGRHPAADVAHRDDVVAVVRHQLRHRPVRDADLPALPEQVEPVLGDPGVDRRAAPFPVGEQHVEPDRIEHRPRQDVRADLRALLQHDHRQLRVELLQPDRRGQPRRAGADDHHVVLHGLALDLGHARLPLGSQSSPPYRAGRRGGQPASILPLAERLGGSYVARPRGGMHRGIRPWPRAAA